MNMKRQITLIVLFLILGITSMMAVPAKRGVKKILTLADGTRIEAELRGDENLSYFEAADGSAFQLRNDVYERVDLQSICQEWQIKVEARNAARRLKAASAHKASFTGKKKGLVILVNFTNLSHTFGQADWYDLFNKEGYDKYGNAGSVHDYFYANSYGTFDLEFDVVGPVTVSHTYQYYGAPNDNNNDSHPAGMVAEACKLADEYVNFADYDWDGDGEVEQVYVVYAGYGQAQGADAYTIWPHEWHLSSSSDTDYSALTLDGVTINTYATSCELHGTGKSEAIKIDGIGTACHEFSHCMGLPDFYDTGDKGNFGMDVWDILDYGSYNDDGYCPAAYTSYERMFAGWLTPVDITTTAAKINDMPCLVDEPVAYIIYNQADSDEYYLLENRQKRGFDAALVGHGMLVLHVQYNEEIWKRNKVNQNSARQRMTIIAADNNYSKYGATGSGDPFPGTSEVTSLTDTSTPAATLYENNSDGTKYMHVPLNNICEGGGKITFDVNQDVPISAPVAIDATNVDIVGGSFTANWEAVDGATSYAVVLERFDDPTEKVMYEENLKTSCKSIVTPGKNTKEISSILDNYLVNKGWTGENLYRSPYGLAVGNRMAETNGKVTTADIDLSTAEEDYVTVAVGLLAQGGTGVYVDLTQTLDGVSETETAIANFLSATAAAATFDRYAVFNVDATEGKLFSLTLNNYSGTSDYKGPFYVDFFAVYDGAYNADELLNGVRTSVAYESTMGTSFDFSNLPQGRYQYKVRATTAEGNGFWSNEVAVELVDAIQSIEMDASKSIDSCIYDLSGRQVERVTRGIYIKNGKKFFVK